MLKLEDIKVSFKKENTTLWFRGEREEVLHGVSLSVKEGMCLGILGESGSGKSTLGRVICGLLKPDSGNYQIDDIDVFASKDGLKTLRKSISVVFQDYTTSTNPRFSIYDIIKESIDVYNRRANLEERIVDTRVEIQRLLKKVGLDETYSMRFPHELSGGQLQRVAIARAIAAKPKFILFDEAVSSLDAHTQVQIMDLLNELKSTEKIGYIFITHDLTAITYICDEVIFLYDGNITERSTISDLSKVQDVYARKLLKAVVV